MDPIIVAILDILKFTIPALAAVAVGQLVFKNLLALEETKHKRESRLNAFSTILPMRLAAYERAILYLERIEPASLIQRLPMADVSAKDLQQLILQEINEEYDHNVVQQLYISDEGWSALKGAKFDMIACVNQAAANVELVQRQRPGSVLNGAFLVEQLLNIYKAKESFPIGLAQKRLRAEVQAFFVVA